MSTRGGEFLIRSAAADEAFTPEDFTDEHEAIAETTTEFFRNEVEPHLDALQTDPCAAAPLLRQAAVLGLTGVTVPERYGGMELDLTSAMIVGESLAGDASYSVWHSAHSGIATMPLLWFGTPEQKQRYVPRLVSCEMIAAYCLTEPHAGSDAMAIKTRADLSPDGRHYVLNGQKMWISNAGAAELFTVFAKVGGEQFTAFLVERGYPGLSVGAEEHKMGIKGSSTCALFFDSVPVPVENVLGEIGKGHLIAFNCLNLGRLMLGGGAVGGSKRVLDVTLKYANERQAFGKSIGEFGLMQYKLGEMAARIFAAESMTYRVTGLVEERMAGADWDQPDAATRRMAAFEEFAIECAAVKVFATEVLDYAVDEGVQIHGGYGFHQDYLVERAYRDSRINRIFEGTNEINRLLMTGMLLKRAQRGRLPLVEAVKRVQAELLAPLTPRSAPENVLATASRLTENAKKLALLALGVAFQRFGTAMDQQQEVLAGISDILLCALAMESTTLRARKRAGTPRGPLMQDYCQVVVQEAIQRVESTARAVFAACAEGDSLRTNLAVLKRYTRFEPADTFAVRRRIAERLLRAAPS